MAGTRSSTKQAPSSSPISSQGKVSVTNESTATKRKAESPSAPKSKRGRKSSEKAQTTIEESMPDVVEKDASKDTNMVDETAEKPSEESVTDSVNKTPDKAMNGGDQNGHEVSKNDSKSKMDDTGEIEPTIADKSDDNLEYKTTNGDAVEESSKREDSTPSSILEKGIIYFFFRGRVGINEPSDVGDIARSYMVLRPLPHGAKLGEGAIGDAGNNRLLALPKKVLPASPRDRFMVFVEKAKSSMEDIKKESLTSSDYATATAGTRHTPAATPIGEGVYAITTTGRESHLAYILTIPSELSEVQKDVGLRERGSFVLSAKNPQYAGPANTNLPQGPGYPQEILDEFRSLRWMPVQPKLIDYENAQFLLIGSGADALEKATEQQPKDEKHDTDTPLEEMEKLEHEDEIRAEHLKGDDSIFEDLGLSSKEYPKLQTTW